MNLIKYFHAKASKLYVALTILAVASVFTPTTAVSQAPAINCFPVTWFPNYNGCGAITGVTLGPLNNVTSSCATNNGNNDYSTSGFSEPTIVATIASSMSVTINQDWTNGAGFLYVWIDWDRNAVFNESPIYSNTNIPGGVSTQNFNIVLPANANPGRARMRVKWGGYTGYNIPADPCSGPAMGEWEDYVVNIQPPLPDPTIGGLALTAPGSATAAAPPIGLGNYDIGFNLTNLSGSALSSILVTYTFTGPTSGSTSFTPTLGGPLAPGNTVLVKLPLLANITLADALNPYNVTITLSNAVGANGPGDSNPNNNSLSASVGPALGVPGLKTIVYVGGASTAPAAPWFPNLTNVGTAITYGGLLGAVEFRVRPGTYNDQILIGQTAQTISGIPGGSAVNNVTFLPDPASPYFGTVSNVIINTPNPSTGASNYAVQLNGADFVTFQNLTFGTTSAVAGRLFWLRNGTSYINIQGCVFNGRTVASSNPIEDAIIYSEPTNGVVATAPPNGGFSDLMISGNTFNSGDYALNLDGGISGPVVSNITITNNTINNFFSQGIFVQRYTNPLIQKNTISSTSTNLNPIYGVNLNRIQSSVQLLQNKINFARTGYGVYFASNTAVAGNVTLMANNMINVGNGSTNTYGIYATSYNTANIFQNTINVNTASSTIAAGLYLVSPGANTRVVNNIIYNRGAGYAYYHSNTAYPTESNYNNIYSAGLYLGYTAGTSHTTITTFRSSTARDANSVSKTVAWTGTNNTYLGAIDLLLRGTNTYNQGTSGNVNNDVSDIARRAPPYMGAHELVPIVTFTGGTVDSGCTGRSTTLSPGMTFTATAESQFTIPNGATNVRYQWTRGGIPIFDDGVKIFGALTASLTILNTVPFDEDNYRLNVIVKDGAAEMPTLVDTMYYQYGVFLRVNEPVQIAVPPQSQVVCRGGNVVLSVIASKGRIWGYQWQRDGVNLTDGNNQYNADQVRGSNAVSMTLTNLQYGASGRYRCIIATSCGKNFDTTSEAVVYVTKPTQIVTPPTSQVAQLGGTARFEVAAAEATTGYNSNLTPPVYQWFKGTTRLNDNTRISGASTAVLTIRNLTQTDAASNYYVKVIGACGVDSTSTFALSVADIASTSLTVADVTACPTQNATMTVNPTVTGASGLTLAYQWRRGTVWLTDGAKYSGTKTATLTVNNVDATDAGTDYNVVVSASPANGVTKTSNNIKFTVKQATTITDPASVSICEGQPAMLYIAATGDGAVTYKWSQNGTDVAGATTDTLQFAAITVAQGGKYTATATAGCGPVTSKEAMVNVLTKPVVYGPSEKKISIKEGGLMRFAVATVSDATTKYKWFKDGNAVTNDSSVNQYYTKFDVKIAGDAGKYYCVVSNQCGSTSSDTIEVVVTTGPASVDNGEVAGFSLANNEPNPFSDVTTVNFTIPQTTAVRLLVTDVYGREIATLASGEMAAGTYPVTFNARELNLAAGVYYYTLNAGGVSISKKMMFVK